MAFFVDKTNTTQTLAIPYDPVPPDEEKPYNKYYKEEQSRYKELETLEPSVERHCSVMKFLCAAIGKAVSLKDRDFRTYEWFHDALWLLDENPTEEPNFNVDDKEAARLTYEFDLFISAMKVLCKYCCESNFFECDYINPEDSKGYNLDLTACVEAYARHKKPVRDFKETFEGPTVSLEELLFNCENVGDCKVRLYSGLPFYNIAHLSYPERYKCNEFFSKMKKIPFKPITLPPSLFKREPTESSRIITMQIAGLRKINESLDALTRIVAAGPLVFVKPNSESIDNMFSSSPSEVREEQIFDAKKEIVRGFARCERILPGRAPMSGILHPISEDSYKEMLSVNREEATNDEIADYNAEWERYKHRFDCLIRKIEQVTGPCSSVLNLQANLSETFRLQERWISDDNKVRTRDRIDESYRKVTENLTSLALILSEKDQNDVETLRKEGPDELLLDLRNRRFELLSLIPDSKEFKPEFAVEHLRIEAIFLRETCYAWYRYKRHKTSVSPSETDFDAFRTTYMNRFLELFSESLGLEIAKTDSYRTSVSLWFSEMRDLFSLLEEESVLSTVGVIEKATLELNELAKLYSESIIDSEHPEELACFDRSLKCFSETFEEMKVAIINQKDGSRDYMGNVDFETLIMDIDTAIEDSEYLIKGLQMPSDCKLDIEELVGLSECDCCGPCGGDDIFELEKVYPYELLLPQSSFVENMLRPFSVENLERIHNSRRSKTFDQSLLQNKFKDLCGAWIKAIDFLSNTLPQSNAIVRLQAAYKEIREGLADQIQFCRMEFCLMEGHADALKAFSEIMLSIATEFRNKDINKESTFADTVAGKVVEGLKNKGGRPKKSEHRTGYITQGEVAMMFGPPCTAGKVANWEAKARGAKRGSNPPTAIIKGERFYYSEDLRINRTARNMEILAAIVSDYQSRHAIKQNVKDKPKNVHAKNEETLARMQGVAQAESRKLHQNP